MSDDLTQNQHQATIIWENVAEMNLTKENFQTQMKNCQELLDADPNAQLYGCLAIIKIKTF